MIKILITGANSYVGTYFEKYLKQWPDRYQVDTLNMLDSNWREKDFSCYDVVYHVAGIAHSDNGKITEEKEKKYRLINTDLTIETATKAKGNGVKQFIFMSSAIVYGESGKIGKSKIITKNTLPKPINCYGDSKLQAELGLNKLNDKSFKVVCLRSPMIYGKGCKGNFTYLEKFSKFPFFPYIKNERSMIYIGNLAEFVRIIIDNEDCGTFWPQNNEYSNTSELVRMIAKARGKKIHLIKGTTFVLKFFALFSGVINKAFGNFTYDKILSEYKENYCKFSLEDSIAETEN